MMQEVIKPEKPAMLAERIEKCFECGYSFEGLLAQAGACPECGLAYDEWSRVFQVSPNRFLIALTMLIGVGQAIASMVFFFIMLKSTLSLWIDVLFLVCTLGSGTGAIVILLNFFERRSKFNPFVACLAKGFYFAGAPADEIRFFPWADFDRYRVTGRYSIFGAALQGADIEVNVCGPFRSRAELEEFIEIVKHHLADG